jgi:hypothetical protein
MPPGPSMSALPPKADMCSALGHVRFVPIADTDWSPVHFKWHLYVLLSKTFNDICSFTHRLFLQRLTCLVIR